MDDEAEAAPSEEIEAQKELLMTDNSATNEMDEAYANEGEVLDMNAAVKVMGAELEIRTDTKKIEGIWQSSLNAVASDATAAKEETGPSAPSWRAAPGSACSRPEHSGGMLVHLGTATARSSRPVEVWVSTTSAERRRGSAPLQLSELMSKERRSATTRCRTWRKTQRAQR
mmetsp:Transcript_105838/g.338007  ORF Transcript_105838/g.338007 Transcript_105838/m.338007 type:complete len:171 (+) Transcript_105838:256-768(+)